MSVKFSGGLGWLTLLLAGVPAAWGQDALDRLDRSLDGPPAAQSVLVPRSTETGYLGLTVDLVAPEGNSVYIVSLADQGPAARAGLKAKDVIVEVNRQPIGGLDDLDQLVRRPVGTRLEFVVRREGALKRVSVTLGERPESTGSPVESREESRMDELPPPAPPAAESRSSDPGESPADAAVPRTDGGPTIVQGSRPILGISVADISDLTRRRFGVTVDTGAVISSIHEGAPAAQAGLPLGGVIVSINGRRIGSANDIVEMVQAFRPGEEVEITYFEGDRVGRKKVRLGRSAAAVVPTGPEAGTGDAAAPSEPELRLGRRRGQRPLLDALERTLDAVLAPTPESRSADSETPPFPPPPARDEAGTELPAVEFEPPGAELPGPEGDVTELEQLREQAQTLQKQLEQLLRRIEELEKKGASPPPAPAAGAADRR